MRLPHGQPRQLGERVGVFLAEFQQELPAQVGEPAAVLPPWLFEHPAAELSVDDSAQLCEDRRQPDHIA